MKVINDRQFSFLNDKETANYYGVKSFVEDEIFYKPEDCTEYKDLFTVDLREEKAAKIINNWFDYYNTFFYENWDDDFLGTLSAGFDTRIIFGFLKKLNRHLNILNYDRETSINNRNRGFKQGLDLVLPEVLCSYFNLDVTFFKKEKIKDTF